jgi:hypothetical protein
MQTKKKKIKKSDLVEVPIIVAFDGIPFMKITQYAKR